MDRQILVITKNSPADIVSIENLKKIFAGTYSIKGITMAREEIKSIKKYRLVIMEACWPELELCLNEHSNDGVLSYKKELKELLKEFNIPILFWSWGDCFEQEINTLIQEGYKVKFLRKTKNPYSLLEGVEKFIQQN